MKKAGTVFVISLLLCAQAVHADDSAAPHCRYTSLATLPVEVIRNEIVVEGSINGKTAPMLIDTGAAITTLTSKGVDFFGLTLIHSPVSQIGVSGDSETYAAVADDMALGKFHTRPHRRLLVAMNAFVSYNLIVGANIIFGADLEMNLADHYLKLFEPSGCGDASLAYWNKDASDVALYAMSPIDLRQVVTVEINGQKLRAVIDSGAQYSLVNKAFAARLGITPESPNVKSIGSTAGIGTHKVDTWAAKFDSFSIGDETVKNPTIRMMDIWGAAQADLHNAAASDSIDEEPEMLLGADFLRAHRVLFALSQHRFYFSYVGGDVFPVPKQRPPKVGSDQLKSDTGSM
jgi:hypothetical protein